MILKTTKHETTPESQLKKAWEELTEFLGAREFWLLTKKEEDAIKMIDEGIDFCKALSKWSGDDKYDYKLFRDRKSIDSIYTAFEALLYQFVKLNREGAFYGVIEFLLEWLRKVSIKLNLNFENLVKENDKKNDDRGVDKKVYLSERDVLRLKDIKHFLVVEQYESKSMWISDILEKVGEK